MKNLPAWAKAFIANDSEVILRRRDMISYDGNLAAFYEGIHDVCRYYNLTAHYDDKRKEFRFVKNPAPVKATLETSAHQSNS